MFQKVASKFFRTQQNAIRPFKLYRVFHNPSIFFQLVPTNRWFFRLRTVSFLQLLSFITPSTAPTTTLPTTVVHFAEVEEFCHSRRAGACSRRLCIHICNQFGAVGRQQAAALQLKKRKNRENPSWILPLIIYIILFFLR